MAGHGNERQIKYMNSKFKVSVTFSADEYLPDDYLLLDKDGQDRALSEAKDAVKERYTSLAKETGLSFNAYVKMLVDNKLCECGYLDHPGSYDWNKG